MDLTGLYNAIMQLIFIVTGLVSIRSLTDMITQLVGQGDALKDGEETAKEVRKRVGQTAAIGLGAGGLAVKGAMALGGAAKMAGGAAKDLGSKAWNSGPVTSARDKISDKAHSVAGGVSGYVGGSRIGRAVGNFANRKTDRENNYRFYEEMGGVAGMATPDGYEKWREKQEKKQARQEALSNAKAKAFGAGAKLKGGVSNLGHSVADSIDKQMYARDEEGNKFKTNSYASFSNFAAAGQGLNKQILAATGISGVYKSMADDGAIPDYNNRVSDAWKSIQGDKTSRQEKKEKDEEKTKQKAKDERELQVHQSVTSMARDGTKVGEVKINAEKATTTTSGGTSVAGAGAVHTPNGDASSLDAHIEGPVGVENAGSSLDFSLDNEDMARLIGSINSTDASIATRLQALAASNLYVAEKINEMKREVVNSVQQNKEATNKVADAVKNITGSDTSGNKK